MGRGARLGIDFGSSHTVAVLHLGGERYEPLLFDASPLLPSAILADDAGGLQTGRDAERGARLDPTRFEPNPKRRSAGPDLDGAGLGGRGVAGVVLMPPAALAVRAAV